MPYTRTSALVKVQLGRNLVRQIKRGHAWVYADALRQVPNVPAGTPAVLLDNRGGREIARGFLDPSGPIAFRACTTLSGEQLNDRWAAAQMQRALEIRQALFGADPETTAYRLFNGEGDGLPGLVCDVYARTAVLLTDGPAPAAFWQVEEIAGWLADNAGVQAVFHKSRDDSGSRVEQVYGREIEQPVDFRENGLRFTADLLEGQKSGFFLDQRANRALIEPLAKDRRMLNAFGYTGGFSVYAGRGGAAHVITLDQSAPALAAAETHWALNGLDPARHEIIADDAFAYLENAVKKNQRWDLVILDPPSFAPSEASVPAAVKAYTRLIALGAQVTASNGLLAAASCSSHIRRGQFLEIIEEAVSEARRKAGVLGIYGQPPDHPAPLVMPELRYLKFVLMQLD